jgi:hypothetical protein
MNPVAVTKFSTPKLQTASFIIHCQKPITRINE